MYIYVCTQGSPAKTQSSTHWNLIGRRMTAPQPLLSPSSNLPPPSSHFTFIPSKKNSGRAKKKSLFFSVLLCPFAKLRKATISFSRSVYPFVLPSVRMEQLGSHWKHFHEIWYLSIFRKFVEKIPAVLKPEKNNEYVLHMQTYLHL